MYSDGTPMDIDSDNTKPNYDKYTYPCSHCGTMVDVDPILIYDKSDITKKFMMSNKAYTNYWHSKYAYAKEIEDGNWVVFCKKVCEINYNRYFEPEWECPNAKK